MASFSFQAGSDALCIDDHYVKKHDFEEVGNLALVCTTDRIEMLMFRSGRHDILWTVNTLARVVRTESCDQILARLMSYIHVSCIFGHRAFVPISCSFSQQYRGRKNLCGRGTANGRFGCIFRSLACVLDVFSQRTKREETPRTIIHSLSNFMPVINAPPDIGIFHSRVRWFVFEDNESVIG